MSGVMLAIAKLPLIVSVSIIATICVAVSLSAIYLIRRIWPYPSLRENNELVGFTYAVYGLIYGVLLAFTIVVGWQHFAEAEQLVTQEATILSALRRDSHAFPPAIRDGIQRNLSAYARSVVDREWAVMADRGKADAQTQRTYEQLWVLTYSIQPTTRHEEAFFMEFLARMNDLSRTRRSRILYSRSELHSVLWLVLLVGGVGAVAYTVLFSGRHTWIQVAIMANVMLIVLLGLLVTLTLQYPFTGRASIKPTAFVEVLRSFEQREREFDRKIDAPR